MGKLSNIERKKKTSESVEKITKVGRRVAEMVDKDEEPTAGEIINCVLYGLETIFD